MLLKKRYDAGKWLAEPLLALNNKHQVVLALLRGGMSRSFECAPISAAPLDIGLVRKIGAPYYEALAVGAITHGGHPELVTDPKLVAHPDIPQMYLEQAKPAAPKEIACRRHDYSEDRRPSDVPGCTVFVVDDGIATEATMLVVLRATRRRKPARFVLAVPVASKHALKRPLREVDQIVGLDTPADFFAMGQLCR